MVVRFTFGTCSYSNTFHPPGQLMIQGGCWCTSLYYRHQEYRQGGLQKISLSSWVRSFKADFLKACTYPFYQRIICWLVVTCYTQLQDSSGNTVFGSEPLNKIEILSVRKRMTILSFDILDAFLLHSWQSYFQTVVQCSVLESDPPDSSFLSSHLSSLLPCLSVDSNV